MRIHKVPHAVVPADQDELLKLRAFAAGLQQMEDALHRDVHYALRSLLAGGQVQHVGGAAHRLARHLLLLQRPAHHLQPGPRLQHAVVAQCPHRERLKLRLGQDALHKRLPHLPRCTRNQNPLRLAHGRSRPHASTSIRAHHRAGSSGTRLFKRNHVTCRFGKLNSWNSPELVIVIGSRLPSENSTTALFQ